MKWLASSLAAAMALALSSCAPRAPGEASGASPRLVETGRRSYVVACAPCHGVDGDGAGPSAAGMAPPPRDLRQGLFKFGWVMDGLPRDEDLDRILRWGLHGTSMPGWELGPREIGAVAQYIKTFAPDAWADPGPGAPVVASPDPWGAARDAEAVERGRELYHGTAQCWSCHPAHEPRAYIARVRGSTEMRRDLYDAVPRASDYLSGGRPVTILPPDFTFARLRSVRAGTELEDLFAVIAAGIPGTAMPTWKDALPDEDIWALAHYVRSLAALRGTPAAAARRAALLDPVANPGVATVP